MLISHIMSSKLAQHRTHIQMSVSPRCYVLWHGLFNNEGLLQVLQSYPQLANPSLVNGNILFLLSVVACIVIEGHGFPLIV